MDDPDQQETPTPFSFKLMIVLLVIYLAYRLAQVAACIPPWLGSETCPYL